MCVRLDRELANACCGAKITSNEARHILKAWNLLGVTPSLLVVALLLKLGRAWDDLPDQVASHFDFSGDPNSWISKRSFAVLAAAFGFASAVFSGWVVFSSSSHVPPIVPLILNLASFMFFVAFWQVIDFNAYHKPFKSVWILGLVAIMLVLILLGIFWPPGALKN